MQHDTLRAVELFEAIIRRDERLTYLEVVYICQILILIFADFFSDPPQFSSPDMGSTFLYDMSVRMGTRAPVWPISNRTLVTRLPNHASVTERGALIKGSE